MKKTLAERMNEKAVVVANTTEKKGVNTMEKKPENVKVIKNIGNVLVESNTSNMVRFFADRMKTVYLQKASDTIKASFKRDNDFFFETIVKASDIEYLANCFDKFVIEALQLSKGKKNNENVDIEYLETFMSKEDLLEYLKRENEKSLEYTFEELQGFIIQSFEGVLSGMVKLFNTIIL